MFPYFCYEFLKKKCNILELFTYPFITTHFHAELLKRIFLKYAELCPLYIYRIKHAMAKPR